MAVGQVAAKPHRKLTLVRAPRKAICRVIFLTPSVCGKDGISTLCRQSIRALKPWLVKGGVELEVWSLTEDPQQKVDDEIGITYRFANRDKLRFAGWSVSRTTQNVADTLIVAFHVGVAPIALPLALRGAELSIILLGIEVWRTLGRLQATALRRAPRLLSISAYTAEQFQRHNPHLADLPIDVCHLGSSSAPFCPQSTPDTGDEALIVARMSAAERYKGHDLLLDIWPRVQESLPEASLIVAGDGDDRPRLEQKASRMGLADCIEFVGRVSDEQLAGLYRRCAFYVMPSPKEGFGLVFLEAMRAKKACIGAEGAASEIIEDGVTGVVVDPQHPSVVLDAVVQLFREPETRRRMGEAGARRFRQYFTEQHFGRRFTTLLGLTEST